ncbi:methionyl-tRNA synthetase [Pancytospora philotis]|nr:methionyl-tRNA synthetase [Pancytospora philotis]
MAKRFVTAALPYVNNQPHLGNIVGCVLGGDVYARFSRKAGHDVVYVCGTDEYGTATEMEAMKQNVHPREIVEKNRVLHKKVYDWLGLSFDVFGKTDCADHIRMTQEMFHLCNDNGYFEARSFTQFYCRSCAQFLADRYVEGECRFCGDAGARGDQCDKCGRCLTSEDINNPRCVLCSAVPCRESTDHLYLRLDLLQSAVKQCFSEKKRGWTKSAQEIYEDWMKKQITARCMTRSLKYRWGVPVPLEGFEDKVFYVWFDAPVGYFTFLSQHRADWREWVADAKFVQFMGKDNVPFHSVIFPAMILAALGREAVSELFAKQGLGADAADRLEKLDLGAPKGAGETHIHGRLPIVDVISSTEYLQFNGSKFSKSRGVGIFGLDLVNKDIGCPDIWRFYLTKRRPETIDSNFSIEDFIVQTKADLIDNLGNLFNRTLKYLNSRADGKVRVGALDAADEAFVELVNKLLEEHRAAMEATAQREALEKLLEISQRGNQYLQTFQAKKERLPHGFAVCYSLLVLLAHLAEPFIPDAARKMFEMCAVPAEQTLLTPAKFEIAKEAEISKDISVLFVPFTPAQLELLREYIPNE